MRVDYTHDNAVMGKLEPGSFDWGHGLESWKVTSDGTSKAVLLATFRDGRSVAYDRIPSAPGQMNFINIGDPKIQRIDLSCVEGVLEIGLVSSESSMQLRFRLDEKPEG